MELKEVMQQVDKVLRLNDQIDKIFGTDDIRLSIAAGIMDGYNKGYAQRAKEKKDAIPTPDRIPRKVIGIIAKTMDDGIKYIRKNYSNVIEARTKLLVITTEIQLRGWRIDVLEETQSAKENPNYDKIHTTINATKEDDKS